ncbi:acyl carrier protein [Candidatus Saccharibacteria bacterium]|nr:acyl carrier protein [Candidatus Saccharibacteria bacterium]MBQ3271193.1 acyl carrier protein [Candidatus Saccharibacteria bacterium]
MKEEVIDLISETLDIDKDELDNDTDLARDLNVESIDLVDLVTAFEDKYHFEIPDQELKNLQTVGDIVKYVEKRQK